MILLNNVKKKFKNKKILDGVNLNIKETGIYWIKGENGEGKSTFFNIISGCLKYKGRVINDHKKNMGYLFQSSTLVEYLTIKEQLDLFNIDADILKEFNLMEKRNQYPASLSSGERQKLAILLVLYSNCELILLDEPFSNLDKEGVELIKKKLVYFKTNKIILIISHQKDIENICDRILELKKGELKYKKIKKTGLMKPCFKERKKVNNGFKFFKKQYFKMYSIYLLSFLLLSIFQFSKILVNNLVEEDILNSVDYNKFYLKSCKTFDNNGFKVSRCKNPSKEELKDIKDWKYNYDLLLSILYKNEKLSTFYNNVNLKEGKIPTKYNQVIASEDYKIGDILIIEANQIIRKDKLDFYKDVINLEVVGIYEKLTFYDERKIYLHYDLIDKYFRNKTLINNNISVYEYFKDLEIDNYKYLTFSESHSSHLVYEGEKNQFYKSIYEIIDKIDLILGYFKFFIFVFLIYMSVRIYKNLLVSKQKSIAFLLANSFNKSLICIKEVLLVIGPISFITLIFTLICYSNNFLYLNVIYICIFLCLLIVMTDIFYSRKNISKLMREEIW